MKQRQRRTKHSTSYTITRSVAHIRLQEANAKLLLVSGYWSISACYCQYGSGTLTVNYHAAKDRAASSEA
jgi:hypothetical protein